MPGIGDLRMKESQENSGSSSSSQMQEFTESFGFIVLFIVLLILISMTAGEKALFPLLMLILAGMVTVNFSKIKTLIGRYS